jgi:phosphate transport system permease protein
MMVIPLMLRSTVEAIRSVPDEYREAALALGISKWSTIRHVVLPSSSPLVLSGVIISIGRSIGETAAVMLTAGYSALVVHSLFQPAGSMPNMIFLYYNLTIKWPIVGEKVYSAALVLIAVVLLLNLSARIVTRRFQGHAMK